MVEIDIDFDAFNRIFPILLFLIIIIGSFYTLSLLSELSFLIKIGVSLIIYMLVIVSKPILIKTVNFIKNKFDIN